MDDWTLVLAFWFSRFMWAGPVKGLRLEGGLVVGYT